MEALVYDESPIAEYLEGDAVPVHSNATPPSTPSRFAPHGLPQLRDRLRTIRQTAVSVKDRANEQFLERFRYIIVASQLLCDDSTARTQDSPEEAVAPGAFTVKGAVISTAVSFWIAWLIHWLRSQRRRPDPFSWPQLCTYSVLVLSVAIFFALFLRYQYLEFVRRSAGGTLSQLLSESHRLDHAAVEALRFIQEVEVVARGYEIHPLPPVSRLEEKSAISRCRELRALLALSLTAGISQFVQAHNTVQPFVHDLDLQRYHDIYEVSIPEYTEAIKLANGMGPDVRDSLKELRFLFRLHVVARKVFLCDLLALRPGSCWYNIQLWHGVLHSLQDLVSANSHAAHELGAATAREAYGDPAPPATSEEGDVPDDDHSSGGLVTPQKLHVKAQMRRFDAVANGIRSLNAKVHLLRQELTSLAENEGGGATTVSAAVTKHYEQLGADIRGLLVEWERGRNTMFLHVNVDSDSSYSRTSSGLRSPISPSPSLGGLTMVDGGPADALRLLNGEDRKPTDHGALDEEVFEAVATPRKRMSLALTREEKLARLQEDRKKRATLCEQAENTTNMLRELQMVIKHRPHARSSSRITSI